MGERKRAQRRAKRQAAGQHGKPQNENLKLKIGNWQLAIASTMRPVPLPPPYSFLPFSFLPC